MEPTAPLAAPGPDRRGADRRESPRHRVSVRVEYAKEGDTRRGSVYDLGEGGIFICSVAPLDLGAVLELSILTPGELGVVRGEGRVVWTNLVQTPSIPAGMGVRFTDIDPAALRRLSRHLKALP